ncbi:MAG: hypothetical protein GY796_32260 [Chloroflexi bacterium]|nr:hypothetical protein [Chloroflexota bacterium]
MQPVARRKQIVHASVLIGQVKLGRLDGAVSIYKKSILPTMKEQTGFKGTLLLGNPDTHQFIAISIWETRVDMLSGEASAYLQAQLHKIKPFLVRPLANTHYVVSVQD